MVTCQGCGAAVLHDKGHGVKFYCDSYKTDFHFHQSDQCKLRELTNAKETIEIYKSMVGCLETIVVQFLWDRGNDVY